MSKKTDLSTKTREKLFDLFSKSGLSKTEFSKRAGITKQNLNCLAAGKYGLTLKSVENLAEALELETEITFKPKS